MDKNKLLASLNSAKRGPKGKAPLPTNTGLYALGTNSGATTTSQTSTSSSTSISNKMQFKRETTSTPIVKKLKLLQNKPNSAGSSSFDNWEDKAIEVEPNELYKFVSESLNANKFQTAQNYVFGAIKQLRKTKDPVLYQALGQLAKTKSHLFSNEIVTEVLCSLLKKDPTNKVRMNSSAALLIINLLYTSYYEEQNWPVIFVKMFIDDSLGDRFWVDNDHCKIFIDNLITAFNTKLPTKQLMNQDNLPINSSTIPGKQDSTSSSPSHIALYNEDSSDQSGSPFNLFISEIKERLDNQQSVTNRYSSQQEQISEFIVNIVNEQLNRRHMPPEVNKNLVKFLSYVVGIQSIRQQVVNKMEIWLQNPKLLRVAQDLLLSLCINCNEFDNEVIAILVRMRLKTKPMINQFVFGIRELVNQNENTLQVVLRAAINNEMSSNRNRNNMQLIAALFQTKFENATSTLANLIKEMLIKEDCLKPIRAFVREVVRSLRHENLNLTSFVSALCDNFDKYDDVDSSVFVVKERLFSSIADLISLCIFLCVTPATKELLSCVKNERKELLKQIQFQVSEIQRIAIKWLHTSARKFFNPDRNEFVHCLNKVLLIESPEQYYKLDNWPPESDRNFILKLTQEVPLYEETLFRLLNMGLSKEHYLQPTEVIEIADTLIRRAAFLYDGDTTYSLQIQDEQILKMLLKSTTYKPPENIKLPNGYDPPSMAISDWYWKVWLQILLLTSHNSSTIGAFAAKNYPTLSILIEMVITNHFDYPPPSRSNEDLKANEMQVVASERQQILQFESHLAAGSTKIQINESNSLLLSKLITFDPTGIARRPPAIVIDQLKFLNNSMRLGHLLCQSRNPDFLLEIIQKQQKQAALAQNNNQVIASMSWLNELVEMNSDSFSILPTQCLCEFVLSQSNDEESISSNTSFSLENIVLNFNVHEKMKRKEKKKKFYKLIIHFQNVLHTRDSSSKELIEYFMKRLSFSQSSYRQIVIKALSLILTLNPSVLEDEQALSDNIDHQCDSRIWLIEKLPKIQNFDQIKSIACNALKDAILIEAVPDNVSSYTIFLSLYTSKPDQSLILNISRLLIERPVMVKFLIQNDYYKDDFLASCLSLFYKYLADVMEHDNKDKDFKSIDLKEYIVLKWPEKEKLTILNIRIVHAMILLLTHGPSKKETWLYQDFLDLWFNPQPMVYTPECTSQISNLIPDWLKLRLIRSTIPTLVDFAMKDLKVNQLLLFIQTFGIPVVSMEKLFSALDLICKKDPDSVRASITNLSLMKQLVEVEFLRGVKSGYKFAEFIGLNRETIDL